MHLVCQYGHFKVTRMPYATSTFQRTMETKALHGLQWITCLIYIDDIIVFGREFNEQIETVNWSWKVLQQQA